jgi:SAM-dependent methyltransferase
MGEQRTAFLDSEGDRYFQRNAQELDKQHAAALSDPTKDPILRTLLALKPPSILEIGAANGWRLDVAHRLWGARCHGVDPSRAAVDAGCARFPHVSLHVATADRLPDVQVDCVIFGCCLYLCDRADLFRIAAEADRVLQTGGYLIVFDFYPPAPYRNAYAHRPGMFSYKMDYATLWSWHPAYVPWSHEVMGPNPADPDQRLAVSVLRKT